MTINFYDKLNEKQIKDIRHLLEKCDNEFIPPLSTRQSTTQDNLKNVIENKNGIENYLENIKNQNVILAIKDNTVIGFMSYKKNYTCKHISEVYSINIYITTILVNPKFRKQGIAREFYRLLLDRYGDRYIFTRTWSTNMSHINLLESLNFYKYYVLQNDRDDGINTIYFIR